MEVPPPASAWETISTSIDEREENVVPIKKRRPVFFRYAAAAVFIGLAAIGIVRLTNMAGKPEEEATASNNTENNTIRSTNPRLDESNIATTDSHNTTTKAADAPLEDKKPIKSRSKNSLASHAINIKSIAPSAISYYDSFVSNDAGNNSFNAYEDVVPDMSKRYIMLMTPDGNIIRMSKKWSDLICCVSGEEQDEDCKTQLKQWQKKIATSPVSPSSGNFLDLLELVSSLDSSPDM
jgi:hypothetical protein